MRARLGLDPIKQAQQDTSLVNGVVNRTAAFIETLRFMFRGPDLTRVLAALSEKEGKCFFPVFSEGPAVPGCYLYGFQFMPSFLHNYISSFTSTYTF